MKQSHQQSEKIVGVWNVFWYGVLFRAAANTTGKELASEAYRQVSYVNDVTRANEQVLVEYTTDGVLGNSATSYTYGVQRESYAMTRNAAAAGGVTEALISYSSGTYYYTGTGSVANLISGSKKTAYTYTPGGTGTTYTTDSYKVTIRTTDGTTGIRQTYENYAYNGEYTHETPGIQYLRARYYNMTTGTFTSKDTYAGRIESILSQNRYTYAENNPVNFADPSGHAKTKSRLPSLQDNIRVAKGGNGPALKPTVNNPTDVAKAAYQSRRDAAGLPKENTLLDNVRIYNGQEYYNNLLLRTPIPTLMSDSGGALTFAESVAAKVEAARCMGYSYTNVGVQEDIEYEQVIIKNGELVFVIPGTVVEIVFDNEKMQVKEYIFHPANDWGVVGAGSYTGMAMKEEDKYRIAIGPNVIIPNYPDDGRIWKQDYENTVDYVVLLLENKKTGEKEMMKCTIKDMKAHSYNHYPDGQGNLPYEAIADVNSGLIQTGICYPNASNSMSFAPDNVDGGIIEFATDRIDFDIKDYILQEIIVYNK